MTTRVLNVTVFNAGHFGRVFAERLVYIVKVRLNCTTDCIAAFTKALTCLSRYGEELSLYATAEFLSFSATNSSKSAYCRFKYEKQFFSKYNLGALRVFNDHDAQNVTGQLLTKVSSLLFFSRPLS